MLQKLVSYFIISLLYYQEAVEVKILNIVRINIYPKLNSLTYYRQNKHINLQKNLKSCVKLTYKQNLIHLSELDIQSKYYNCRNLKPKYNHTHKHEIKLKQAVKPTEKSWYGPLRQSHVNNNGQKSTSQPETTIEQPVTITKQPETTTKQPGNTTEHQKQYYQQRKHKNHQTNKSFVKLMFKEGPIFLLKLGIKSKYYYYRNLKSKYNRTHKHKVKVKQTVKPIEKPWYVQLRLSHVNNNGQESTSQPETTTDKPVTTTEKPVTTTKQAASTIEEYLSLELLKLNERNLTEKLESK